jgi:hypothetical protein
MLPICTWTTTLYTWVLIHSPVKPELHTSLTSAIQHQAQPPDETEGESWNNQKSKSGANQKGGYMGKCYTVAYTLIKARSIEMEQWMMDEEQKKKSLRRLVFECLCSQLHCRPLRRCRTWAEDEALTASANRQINRYCPGPVVVFLFVRYSYRNKTMITGL